MDSSSENKPFVLRLHERIAASRFLTFSLFLHLIIVVLAGGVVLIQGNSRPQDFPPKAQILIPKADDDSAQFVTTNLTPPGLTDSPPIGTTPLTVIATTASRAPS